MEKYVEIERSIIKKFRKDIWSKFIKAISDYELIKENDNIMVCISGGKDSFLLAKCIQELIKHGKFPFTAHYVVMDPGYNKVNRQLIEKNAKLLNVPIEIFETNIFDVTAKVEGNPCYLCARMRRGYLYSKAKELGCNKIALGHHFDDVIETILLNVLYAGEYKTMMPKLKSTNFEGLELIRPFYYVHESDIKSWVNYMGLHFLNCACSVTDGSVSSKRKEVKELISNLKKNNKNVDINILRSSYNVNLDAIVGFKENGKTGSFLDKY